MLLSEIYLGIENIMLRIAKTFREQVPTGGSWHKELLDQFASDMSDTRPALFSLDTARSLDQYRRFRHVARHVYSFDYDWQQMKRLLEDATPLLEHLINEINTFQAFLDQIASKE